MTVQPDDLKARDPQPHPLANLLPDMPQADYSALVDDIEKHGVRQPIVVYQGQILDGRHRVRAAIETRQPVEIKPFDGTEDEARAYVLSMNVHRRHLNAEQRRALICNELKTDPVQSDRAIAEKVKVSDKTVAAQRQQLESTAEIPQSTKRVGKDGRGGHWLVWGPQGGIVTVAHSSNDNNAVRIIKGEARRHLGVSL